MYCLCLQNGFQADSQQLARALAPPLWLFGSPANLQYVAITVDSLLHNQVTVVIAAHPYLLSTTQRSTVHNCSGALSQAEGYLSSLTL